MNDVTHEQKTVPNDGTNPDVNAWLKAHPQAERFGPSRPDICTAEECLAFDRLVVYRDKKLSPMTISEDDRDHLISMILKLRQAYDKAVGIL